MTRTHLQAWLMRFADTLFDTLDLLDLLGNARALDNARREQDVRRWENQQVDALELRVPPVVPLAAGPAVHQSPAQRIA
ncbi:MAG TPA: hypothetical protein VI916_08815 [Acidimicrobiia bacterium]|nr:hypothetical protein [Acidimicrobiia bacterium]